jgi:hypothetical protein
MKPIAHINLSWFTGMGDAYSGIVTAYYMFAELQEIGYDCYFNFNLLDNIYYPNTEPLSHLFDMSGFKDKITYLKEVQLQEKYLQYPQECKSLTIYVSEVLPGLSTYQYELIYMPTLLKSDIKTERYHNTQFLSQQIVEMSARFCKGEELCGICVRVEDTYNDTLNADNILTNPRYSSVLHSIERFLNNNTKERVFISSNCHSLLVRLCKDYQRLEMYNFTNNEIPLHYSKNNCSNTSQQIIHAQEIATTMHIFSKCKNILCLSNHPTSYLVYGVLHNAYVKPQDFMRHNLHNL